VDAGEMDINGGMLPKVGLWGAEGECFPGGVSPLVAGTIWYPVWTWCCPKVWAWYCPAVVGLNCLSHNDRRLKWFAADLNPVHKDGVLLLQLANGGYIGIKTPQ
jgi:hypothetical protein